MENVIDAINRDRDVKGTSWISLRNAYSETSNPDIRAEILFGSIDAI
jgi:hypothetical protein